MSDDELRTRIMARVIRVRDDANMSVGSPNEWTRLYAEALDDIARMVAPPAKDDVAAGLAAELVAVGIFDYVDGEPRDEAGLSVFIRRYLSRWALVPIEDICPNPDGWPVHAPRSSPRDCQGCRDAQLAKHPPGV